MLLFRLMMEHQIEMHVNVHPVAFNCYWNLIYGLELVCVSLSLLWIKGWTLLIDSPRHLDFCQSAEKRARVMPSDDRTRPQETLKLSSPNEL
jgi:hypothetical protein